MLRSLEVWNQSSTPGRFQSNYMRGHSSHCWQCFHLFLFFLSTTHRIYIWRKLPGKHSHDPLLSWKPRNWWKVPLFRWNTRIVVSFFQSECLFLCVSYLSILVLVCPSVCLSICLSHLCSVHVFYFIYQNAQQNVPHASPVDMETCYFRKSTHFWQIRKNLLKNIKRHMVQSEVSAAPGGGARCTQV